MLLIVVSAAKHLGVPLMIARRASDFRVLYALDDFTVLFSLILKF